MHASVKAFELHVLPVPALEPVTALARAGTLALTIFRSRDRHCAVDGLPVANVSLVFELQS